jgi:hypothetical protein
MAIQDIHTVDPQHTEVETISEFSGTPLSIFIEATEAEVKNFIIKSATKSCELDPSLPGC